MIEPLKGHDPHPELEQRKRLVDPKFVQWSLQHTWCDGGSRWEVVTVGSAGAYDEPSCIRAMRSTLSLDEKPYIEMNLQARENS